MGFEHYRASHLGAVAQLGERLVRNEEVSGSIPLGSTNKINALAVHSAKAFFFAESLRNHAAVSRSNLDPPKKAIFKLRPTRQHSKRRTSEPRLSRLAAIHFFMPFADSATTRCNTTEGLNTSTASMERPVRRGLGHLLEHLRRPLPGQNGDQYGKLLNGAAYLRGLAPEPSRIGASKTHLAFSTATGIFPMLPDIPLIIAIRHAMFEARKDGVNQSGQIERAVAEVLKIRPEIHEPAAIALVEALLEHIHSNDTNNIAHVIEYLDKFEHQVINELHRYGYSENDDDSVKFHIEYISNEKEIGENSRERRLHARIYEQYQALNYITGVRESMCTGSTFTALKYAFRIIVNILGSDARIGFKARLKGIEKPSQRTARAIHAQCAKRDTELRQKYPKWKACQRAKRIEREMIEGKNIDTGTPIRWKGKAIKWDTIQRVVRKLTGKQR